jgi:hypothetical protein
MRCRAVSVHESLIVKKQNFNLPTKNFYIINKKVSKRQTVKFFKILHNVQDWKQNRNDVLQGEIRNNEQTITVLGLYYM